MQYFTVLTVVRDDMEQPRILVVDDEESMGKFMQIMLSKEGYDVIAVQSGAEAVEQIKNKNFDLIIADLMMPKMDGISFLRTLKEKKPKLPVIMITGFSLAYTQQRATQEGADGYLVKPFKIEKIEELVKNLLGERPEKRTQPF